MIKTARFAVTVNAVITSEGFKNGQIEIHLKQTAKQRKFESVWEQSRQELRVLTLSVLKGSRGD
jgi:hypothetical protein